MKRISIIIAEDHDMVREGLRMVLEKEQDFTIVAEVKTGLDAVAETRKLNPSILLLDLTLPKMHGLHVLGQIRDSKKTKVIILTMHRDPTSAVEALRLGARGYVLKDAPSSELIAAIRTVATNGDTFVSQPLDQVLKKQAMNALHGPAPSGNLTARELMVLKEVAQGQTNDGIAGLLGISVRTVEKHRANFMRKLLLRSQADVVMYAVRAGLVQP